jgi:hypothetical protein
MLCWLACLTQAGCSTAAGKAPPNMPSTSARAAVATAANTGQKPLQAQPQQLQQQHQQQQPQQPQSGPHDAADAAMYREMRQALCNFDEDASAGSARGPAPRHKAFYAALRSVLGQVLEEKTEASRHTRLLAAHQWYVKHKPRPKPADMNMAAAMAASLSVLGPTDCATAGAEERQRTACSSVGGVVAVGGSVNSPASRRQQQQQPLCVLGVGQQVPAMKSEGVRSAGDAAAERQPVSKSRSAR